MNSDIQFVLDAFGLNPDRFRVESLGKGHIHATYKVSGPQSYLLQKFNSLVFTRPEVVERNIRLTASYLKGTAPDYYFVSPIATMEGRDLVYDAGGHPWRLCPFVDNSYSIDEASTTEQAYRAAAAFGKLGRLLEKCDVSLFEPAIDRFHDLSFRFDQFNDALRAASSERIRQAADAIAQARRSEALVIRYRDLVSRGILRRRIFHNDTKVNNVLFDNNTHEVRAVVDLDTLMPGYFIYDLGDLVRTIVSPVSEEEKDVGRIQFRSEFYQAIVDGYMSEMSSTLSEAECGVIGFSGQMMTCIMALRFLADFLRGDTYYHTTYPGQNLVRARNQYRLLEVLVEKTT
jgi:Ser/Thr protein kinase RdoA (MazF antagonist)